MRFNLKANNISKSFLDEKVLFDIQFEISSGEIICIVGENGAGKSCFAKILAQYMRPDKGSISINGSPLQNHSVAYAQKHGIYAILNENVIVDSLSIAENFYLGNPLKFARFPRAIDWRTMYIESERAIAALGLHVDTHLPASVLNVNQKVILELARMFYRYPKLIILDDPISSMDDEGKRMILEALERLKKQGVALIFITHDFDDVLQIADKLCMMCDGKMIAEFNKSELRHINLNDVRPNQYVHAYPKIYAQPGRVLLSVKSLQTLHGVRNVSFDLRKGEILGIAGVLGSGRSSLARAIMGIEKTLSGQVAFAGRERAIRSVKDAVAGKIGYLPENRLKESLVDAFGIHKNITLRNLRKISRFCNLSLGRERQIGDDFIKKLLIQDYTRNKKSVRQLSCGTQQKISLSKLLFADCRVLLMEEPTKGLDSVSKVEIYNYMNKLVLDGVAILLFSSNIDELIGMSDRIIILNKGLIVKEFVKGKYSKKDMIYFANY